MRNHTFTPVAFDDAEAVVGGVDRRPEARVLQVDLVHRGFVQLVERHHLGAQFVGEGADLGFSKASKFSPRPMFFTTT